MSASLLSTKLYIPPARPDGVSRPHLIEKIQKGLNQPGSFALISGPAGFGKSSLLSAYVTATKKSVAWVSLDAADNDPNQFWTYVISACQTFHSEFGDSVMSLLQLPQSLPVEFVPSALINELAAYEDDLTLILDDYHTIQNESIHSAVAFLLEHLPKNLHVIIATRIDPPWPLARFRSRNQLVEVRAKDLRFSITEAESFLNRMMELNLTTEDVESLEERTEGWAAGLQLAALSMKGRSDTTGFVNALKGSHVYIAGYLIEEVLMLQPMEVQDFLLQTSILNRLNGELCAAVTGYEQAQNMLHDLQHKNLFVISLDDEGKWFRYHNLFADLLLAKLQSSSSKEKLTELHQRAANWFEKTGMVPEAIDHALSAQDYLHIVKLVESNALSLILQAHVKMVDAWLKKIPLEYIEKSPRIDMAIIWLNLLPGSIPQCMPSFERIRKFFANCEAGEIDPSLHGEWLALESRLLSTQGNPAESRDLGNLALNILPEKDLLVRSMVYINLATTYEQMLDYDHAAETFQMITKNAILIGDFTFEILGRSGQARMELMQGHLRQVHKIATEGIKRFEGDGRKTPFSATLYGELSQIHYQWHELDEFRKNSSLSIQASGKSGYSDPEIYHAIMLSKIAQMEDDWISADEELQKAIDLAGMIPPAMVRENLISQQVRVLLAFDRIKDVEKILRQEGFSFGVNFTHPDLEPDSNIIHPVGLLFVSAVRVLLFLGIKNQDRKELLRGIDLASILIKGELHCNHIPIVIETLLIRSQLYKALGDEEKSLADLLQALDYGKPERFLSVFVEEGKPVAESLMLLLERKQSGSIDTEYIKAMLELFPGSFIKKEVLKSTLQRVSTLY